MAHGVRLKEIHWGRIEPVRGGKRDAALLMLWVWTLIFGGFTALQALNALGTGTASGMVPLTVIGLAWVGGAVFFGVLTLAATRWDIVQILAEAPPEPPDPLAGLTRLS